MGQCGSKTQAQAEANNTLEDRTVNVSPYFKVNDLAKFKATWKAAYEPFAHKDDCVHYAFTFNEDGTRAHCREAYTSAANVLQHLGDVDGPLKAVLAESAELVRLEASGPADELEKLKEGLGPLGCAFFTAEWGFRPTRPSMDRDTVCHLYPYFAIKPGKVEAFKKIWGDAYASTKANAETEKSHQYAFCFEEREDGTATALCREAYADAASVMLHVKNVGEPLGACLDPSIAELIRLEVHAPASEMAALKAGTEAIGTQEGTPQYFEIAWGFRNAV